MGLPHRSTHMSEISSNTANAPVQTVNLPLILNAFIISERVQSTFRLDLSFIFPFFSGMFACLAK